MLLIMVKSIYELTIALGPCGIAGVTLAASIEWRRRWEIVRGLRDFRGVVGVLCRILLFRGATALFPRALSSV